MTRAIETRWAKKARTNGRRRRRDGSHLSLLYATLYHIAKLFYSHAYRIKILNLHAPWIILSAAPPRAKLRNKNQRIFFSRYYFVEMFTFYNLYIPRRFVVWNFDTRLRAGKTAWILRNQLFYWGKNTVFELHKKLSHLFNSLNWLDGVCKTNVSILNDFVRFSKNDFVADFRFIWVTNRRKIKCDSFWLISYFSYQVWICLLLEKNATCSFGTIFQTWC